MHRWVRHAILAAAGLAFAFGVDVGCTQTNVHDTPAATGTPCVQCHAAAYENVQTPVHKGVYPQTCGDCHGRASWTAAGGHPEANFPIKTGAHASPAIQCSDCHISSLGAATGGQNTDCIHCHVGAHTITTVDATHAGIAGYTKANPATPHSCLGCHPKG